MNKIKHIVFDFGGVFLDLGGTPSGIPVLLAQILKLPLDQVTALWRSERLGLATGKETPHDFLERMKHKLNLDFDVDESLEWWKKNYLIVQDRIDWKLVDMLSQLKTQYQLHLLTDQINLNHGTSSQFPEIEKHFQTILRSYEQGLSKPDPAAYYNLLAKIQATEAPDTVVFIDDNEVNIQAAEKCGIHGILYRFNDHMTLNSALEKLGVQVVNQRDV